MMVVAATQAQRGLGAVMIVVALCYLVPFVPRGWMPHDEGMLGQAADRVLHGDIPHVDYEEPYTGGLAWLYAGVFRIAGVDLLKIRWLLFVVAACATFLTYAVLRRYLLPAAAAFATWVAVAWSFPNYFAALPSWWLLTAAVACLWAMIRYVETGKSRHLVSAALAAGFAVAIKQTGVYLVVALILSLLLDAGRADSSPVTWRRVERFLRWGAAAMTIVLAVAMLGPRIVDAEGLYLFLPVLACAVVLAAPVQRSSERTAAHSPLVEVVVAVIGAAGPVAVLLIPYVVRGRLWDFIDGTILIPRERLVFASMPMPSAWLILEGLPPLGLVFVVPRLRFTRRFLTWFVAALWAAAIVLPAAALWHETSYQVLWQSTRAFAALLPLGICWLLCSGRVDDAQQRRVLFATAAILAWTALNQFPFAAPIYFCYGAPLAVIATVAAATTVSTHVSPAVLPWAAALTLFAVFSANRTYIEPLGVRHDPQRFEAPLDLPRAHLKVGAEDARIYRDLVGAIGLHLRGGTLIAGPDCPEVYFLSGLINPAGTMFDFFSQRGDVASWSKGDVIIVNHGPRFTRAPSEEILSSLRETFPHGEGIGRFEIRWR